MAISHPLVARLALEFTLFTISIISYALLVFFQTIAHLLPTSLRDFFDGAIEVIVSISDAMEGQARRVLALLKNSDVPVETRSSELAELKSTIKHQFVPDAAISVLVDTVRVATTSQHSILVGQGLSTLGHLLKRLSLQNVGHLVNYAPRILPLVLEALGDRKDRHRALAMQCLTDYWPPCSQDVEGLIRESAMTSKNPRTKESAMSWLVAMHTTSGMPFRGFVPKLMELLEDADGMVRRTAQHAVVDLFRSTADHAKLDLKKQLQHANVRKTIVADILNQLGLGTTGDQGVPQAHHSTSMPPPARSQAPSISSTSVHVASGISSLKATSSSISLSNSKQASGSISSHQNFVAHHETHAPNETPPPEGLVPVEPAYVTSSRELEEICRNMQPCFEGRESEGNWITREKSCQHLRRLTVGNAPTDYHASFLVCIKSLLDGILKAANSLRTTLSSNGCAVVQELARKVGPGLDPMVEILLQNFIKLCAATKNISRVNGNTTVDTIFASVSYSVRLLQHVWATCTDKNVKPRLFAAGWLVTIISKHGQIHKTMVEQSGGLDLIDKCLRKGLTDADIGVRQNMRKTYWTFYGVWPEKAAGIMTTLDTKLADLLENDPNNPNSPKKSSSVVEESISRRPRAPAKSLKEAIAAQKREAAATPPLVGPRESYRLTATVGDAGKIHGAKAAASQHLNGGHPPTAPVAAHAPSGLSSKPIRRPLPRRQELQRASPSPPPTLEKRVPSPAPPVVEERAHMVTERPETPLKDQSVSHVKELSPKPSAEAPPIPVKERSPTPTEELAGSSENDVIPTVYQDAVTPSVPVSDDKQLEPVSEDLEKVLGELSLNESILPSAPLAEAIIKPTGGATRSSKTLREPDGHTRKLIDSGIKRVRTKSLDHAGYRKLQRLIETLDVGEDVWDPSLRLDELLSSLVSYIVVPRDVLEREATCFRQVHDLKGMALQIIRVIYSRCLFSYGTRVPETIVALLAARSSYRANSEIVRSLLRTADTLYDAAGSGPEIITASLGAVLDILDAEEVAQRPFGDGKVIMGLQGVGKLLERSLNFGNEPVDEEMHRRIGETVLKYLKDEDALVRRAAIGYCAEFHKLVGVSGNNGAKVFWKVLDGATRDQKNLIAYYLSKDGPSED